MRDLGACSLEHIAEGGLFRARGGLYKKRAPNGFVPVAVTLGGAVVETGSLLFWPFPARPLQCEPVTTQELMRNRVIYCTWWAGVSVLLLLGTFGFCWLCR